MVVCEALSKSIPDVIVAATDGVAVAALKGAETRG